MRESERRRAAINFAKTWKGRGYEKGESQPFWLGLLRDVFGVTQPEDFIFFEEKVLLDKTSFIDAVIPSTHVLIEQKSLGTDLRKSIRQSDGTYLDPFKQAKRYSAELPFSKRPRYIVTSNFESFLVYDMEKPSEEPQEIKLAEFPKEYYRLDFLVESGNTHLKREMALSIEAGEIVGELYEEILKHYHDPTAAHTLKSLNILCVRLVFCLYAEDAGIFGNKKQFHDYLSRFEARDLRRALMDLFKVLDTKYEDRDIYLDEELAAFPYVNGELFCDNDIEIPQLDERVKDLLLARASDDFDWSDISPTIFGAVFESTLNPETRRSGGMHYTSIENIHKVIDPLFLDDLKAEFKDIKTVKTITIRRRRLREFQEKLASLRFLDPACGSGNFLTETYLSLRRLENEVLVALNAEQIVMNVGEVIKVSIEQFYGIEINDFAVSVAKTALWIAESQMIYETKRIVQKELDFLPLKSLPNITEANALQINWNDVVSNDRLNYIMGNPPFSGARTMTPEQKQNLFAIFGRSNNSGNLDFVCCWFKKAADYMAGTSIRTALVATNSITQGEQVAILWPPLLQSGNRIDFACRTFRWDSEAKSKAHVHCVIIGFSIGGGLKPILFDETGKPNTVTNINPYLVDAPNIVISSRNKPLCDVPGMTKGSQPTDDGNFLMDEAAKNELIKVEPSAESWIRPFLGAEEFINQKKRYCLWLLDIKPDELRKMPKVLARIEKIRQFRLKSSKAQTRKKANTPTRFDEIRQPTQGNYLLVPSVSSERRMYVPIGFLSSHIVASNLVLIIPDATLYHFGVLTSVVHNAWMRTVCGRLKSDYRYSVSIVYNNFPWPTASPKLQEQIASTAQGILDARALFQSCSLADLYDETTMPIELRLAHHANDHAVMQAYGFSGKMTEPDIVAELMKRYQTLTNAE
ncbi:MAG: DNA methyltransferase [Lentisphaeria bacterium]|jgi:type I restriction-modification system DNA methylase subunit